MESITRAFVERVSSLLQIGVRALAADDANVFQQFRSGSLSLLRQVYGEHHPFFRDFNERVVSAFRDDEVSAGLGILHAVKTELEGGWLATVKGFIAAEIFSDYLEMARYLCEEGYKDPAAVIAGSTLESHLRQLCARNSIPTEVTKEGSARPKPADLLNSELAGANVYNKSDQKSVTAWLDLRNNAAHGHYEKYTQQQAALMIQSVADFITRTPV